MYYLVGMSRNAATRTARHLASGRKSRLVRIGPFVLRPNRSVPCSLEQIQKFSGLIMKEHEAGRLMIVDGNRNPVDLHSLLDTETSDVADFSNMPLDELLGAWPDAREALSGAIKAAVNEGDEEALSELLGKLQTLKPPAGDLEAMVALALTPAAEEEATPELEEPEPASEEPTAEAVDYSEMAYGELLELVRNRGIEVDSRKKDDLVAALELHDDEG